MFVKHAYTDKRVCSIVDHMQQTLDQHSIVSARLFPGRDVADLALLDREQLLQLAFSGGDEHQTSAPPLVITSTSGSASDPTSAAAIQESPLPQSNTSPDTVTSKLRSNNPRCGPCVMPRTRGTVFRKLTAETCSRGGGQDSNPKCTTGCTFCRLRAV